MNESAPQKNVLIITSLVLAVVFFVLPKAEARKIEDNFAADPDGTMAIQFKNAFSPYTFGMGTDVDMVMSLAAKCRGGVFSRVSAKYRTLYKSSLADDLQSELSASELELFTKILRGVNVPSPKSPSILDKILGVLKKEKTPEKPKTPTSGTKTAGLKGEVYANASAVKALSANDSRRVHKIFQKGSFIGKYKIKKMIGKTLYYVVSIKSIVLEIDVLVKASEAKIK